MYSRKRLAALALCLLPNLAPTAEASTLGLPILTTEPGTLFFVNQFGPDLLPTDSFTMTYNGLIATAQGAVELVGKAISFTWFFNGGFDDGTVYTRLFIDGQDLQATNNDFDQYLITIFPPIATDTPTGTPGISTWTYDPPFNGFGPRDSATDAVQLYVSLSVPIPTRTGYQYCFVSNPFNCQFSNTPGLTEIGGSDVTLDATLVYPEGSVQDATVTFSTVDGRAPAPVPLPAAGALLVVALGALAAVARRKAAI